MVVWDYDLPSSASAVSWAVIVNNIAALEMLLDCGYARAAVLAMSGAVVRAVVGWVIMSCIGLESGVEGWDFGLGLGGEWRAWS